MQERKLIKIVAYRRIPNNPKEPPKEAPLEKSSIIEEIKKNPAVEGDRGRG
jgi:hypothetical protein